MGATTTFKQQCPTCETMVPVKEVLIGKTIKCPKCLAPFKVEKPPEERSEDEGTREKTSKQGVKAAVAAAGGVRAKSAAGPATEKGKKPKGKKTAPDSPKQLGVALAAVALLLLAAGVWFFFFRGDPNRDSGLPPPRQHTDKDDNKDKDQDPKNPGDPKAKAVVDVTNLLPNDADAVVLMNLKGPEVAPFFPGTLASILFEGPGGFKPESFKMRYGFALADVQQFALATGMKGRWTFAVLRTVPEARVFKESLEKGFHCRPGPRSAELGFDYFISSEAADALTVALFKRLENRPTAFHVYDEHTLVIADVKPMEDFLASTQEGMKRQPAYLTAPTPPPTPPAPKPAEPATDDGTVPPPDARDATPQPAAKPAVVDSFLTVKPDLKRAFDTLEWKKRTLTVAFDPRVVLQAGLSLPGGVSVGPEHAQLYRSVFELELPPAIGLSLFSFTQDRVSMKATAEVSTVGEANTLAGNIRAVARVLLPMIEENYRLDIRLRGERAPADPDVPPEGGDEKPDEGGAVARPAGGAGAVDSMISWMDVAADRKSVVITLELRLSDHSALVSNIRYRLTEQVTAVRNSAMIPYHTSRRHLLAEALMGYVKQKDVFPRGTADRPKSAGQPFPWRADERLAWTAEVLPYLGEPFGSLPVDPKLSWTEGVNETTAAMLIPHLMAPDRPAGSYPASTWLNALPQARSLVGATHFVGMAGVGMEAADYDPADEAVKKQRGVFNYQHATKPAEITDGREQTIALIQVPPAYRTCWLAGGGATVRGVPETNPLAPFVCTEFQGKKGTFAIMADGKLRFIPADMPPDTFKALCTIAGGEKVENLDTIAPPVEKGADDSVPAPDAGKPEPAMK